MAENNLEKQLAELFGDLTGPPLGESFGEETATDETPPLSLADLFSPERDDVFGPANYPRLTARRLKSALPQKESARDLPAATPTDSDNVEPESTTPASPAALAPDPRQQQRALIAQLSQWGPEPLLEILADGNRELAIAALINLLQMSESANQVVLDLTKVPGRDSLARGGEAYISHLLGQKFIYIPPGPFLMGSDPTHDELTWENEQPRHRPHVPGFWISRYLITAGHYQVFLKQTAYQPAGPVSPDEETNRPVADVTWTDALAYCRWLSDRSGLPVTLPSEAEWEKAARGTDGRRYPWGNQPPGPHLCNVTRSTSVGRYSPQSDSPFGCADMAGNVWEWTRSQYRPYPYQANDGREQLDDDQPRVVRGLTFNNPAPMTRCAYRYRLEPQIYLPTLGFRVVVSAGS